MPPLPSGMLSGAKPWQARGMYTPLASGRANIPAYPLTPSYTNPAGWIASTLEKSVYESDPNAVVRFAVNRVLRFLDPPTQRAMMNWLAEQDPTRFNAYRAQSVVSPPMVSATSVERRGGYVGQFHNPLAGAPAQMYLDRNRVVQMAQELDVNSVVQALTGKSDADTVRKFTSKNPSAVKILNFMKNYLLSAAAGMPVRSNGRITSMPTALEREFAMDRLGTLERQAQSDRELMPVLDVVHKMVNPVLIKPPEWGGPGGGRSVVTPPREAPQRGGVHRNPAWV